MGATVSIAEINGAAPGTQTDAITNTNMGSNDSANLVAATYPITAGTNSYEKFQHFHVSASGGSSKIQNFKIWVSANYPLATGATLYTNATTTNTQYLNPSWGGYKQGVTTASTSATWQMPKTTPSTSNVGINGSILTDTPTSFLNLATLIPCSSDWFCTQIKTSSDATAGTTVTMSYQYDEVA